MSPTRHVTWFKTRWFISIVVILCLSVIGLYVAGRSLPQQHVASVSRDFNTSQHDVWLVLSDFADWPKWRSDLREIKLGHNGFTEISTGGEAVEYRIEEFDTPERIVIRIASTDLPFGGSWTFELTPLPEGCRVTITETGEVYNPIFRFISKYLIGHTTTMQKCLDDLGKKLP